MGGEEMADEYWTAVEIGTLVSEGPGLGLPVTRFEQGENLAVPEFVGGRIVVLLSVEELHDLFRFESVVTHPSEMQQVVVAGEQGAVDLGFTKADSLRVVVETSCE